MNLLYELKKSKNSINVIENNQLQEKINNIKLESEKLNNKLMNFLKRKMKYI